MPKEKSFPIPLKYVDVNRSTHTDFDVAQENRIDDYFSCRRKQKFARFIDRFHKIYAIE